MAAPSDQTLAITDDEGVPTVSLALSSSSIDEDGSTTVTARTLGAVSSEDGHSHGVLCRGVADRVRGTSARPGRTLTIAAGATSSTGTVTIAAVDNAVDGPDKEVTVSPPPSPAATAWPRRPTRR